jgi:hypothetical protein
MEQPLIYIINYNNEDKLKQLKARFDTFGLNRIKVPSPVHTTDPRLINITPIEPRTWAIMLQHLDALRDFVFNNPTEEYCIVCEDDILLSTYFTIDFQEVKTKFKLYKLDILLLAYLIPFKLENQDPYKDYPILERRRFYSYPDDLWGSQMYAITRSQAIELLQKYTIDWALQNPEKPYSPDWIITKKGRRALVYPPLALENGTTNTNNEAHQQFHLNCFNAIYKYGEYI